MASTTATSFGSPGGTINGAVVELGELPPGSTSFIGFLKGANAAGNTTAVIEHSPDGVNWFSVYTLSVVGNAVDTDTTIQLLFGKLRATITTTGAVDVTCQMWFDPNTKR